MSSARQALGLGRSQDSLRADMEQFAINDVRWRYGRAFSLAYYAGPEAVAIAEEAYRRFSGENALNVDAFPSLRKMSSEVVDVTLGWTHAPVDAAGFLTSGGTESLIMAVWAAIRRREREAGHSVERSSLNVVLPTSAHAALEKACSYFGVQSRRVPVREDWRADVDALRAACDEGTILVVASAPQYPQGVIDDVASVAEIAVARGVNCHVDACMGGVTLTYMERGGATLPLWDFRVEGVTSISIDLHKYGYTSKGAGVLLHRNKLLRSDQVYMTDNWLGGLYGSSGILGTKSGGPIASAWAVLHFLGDDGYLRVTQSARATALRIASAIENFPELSLRAQPDTTLLSFGMNNDAQTFALADELRRNGWYVDKQGPPPSLHLTVNAVHEEVCDEFLADLGAAVRSVVAAAGSPSGDAGSARYGTVD